MAKMKDSTILIIVLIAAVVLYTTSGSKFFSVAPPNTAIAAPSSCAGIQKGQPSITAFASYPDPTNNGKQTQVAVAVNAYSQGISSGTVAAVAGTTSASAVTFVNGTLPCGYGGTIFFGAYDGGSYYPVGISYPVLTSAGGSISVTNIPKEATLSATTISNATSLGKAMTGVGVKGVTAGKAVSAGGTAGPFTMTLTTGSGVWGTNATEVTFGYNGLSIQNVVIMTASGQACAIDSYALPSAVNVVQTGYISKTYACPAQTSWNTATNFQISVQTSSAFATNEPISVSINDKLLYFQSGVGTPVVVNPNTNADLGQAILSFSNANTVNSLDLDQVPIRLCGPNANQAGC